MSYLIYWIASLCLKLHGVVGHGELPLLVGNLDELLDLTEVRLRLLALSKGPIIYVVHKMMKPELMQLQFVWGLPLMTSHWGRRLCEYARGGGANWAVEYPYTPLIHWGRHVCILKSYLGQPPVDVFRDLGVDLRVAAPPELDRLVLAHRVVAILDDN